jgi:hypothetical protein
MKILENKGFADSRSVNNRNHRPRWMGKEKIYQSEAKMKFSGSFSSLLYILLDSYTIGGDREIKWVRKLLPRSNRHSNE